MKKEVYICDICGKQKESSDMTYIRTKYKTQQKKLLELWDEYGSYKEWHWVDIDICDDCLRNIATMSGNAEKLHIL